MYSTIKTRKIKKECNKKVAAKTQEVGALRCRCSGTQLEPSRVMDRGKFKVTLLLTSLFSHLRPLLPTGHLFSILSYF